MAKIKFFKVAALPGTPVADAVYYVQETGNKVSLYVTDSSGVAHGIAFPADVDTYVASGVESGGTLTLTMNDASTVSIDLSGLLDDTNKYLASGAVSGDTMTLTLSDSSTVDVDVSSLHSQWQSTEW